MSPDREFRSEISQNIDFSGKIMKLGKIGNFFNLLNFSDIDRLIMSKYENINV